MWEYEYVLQWDFLYDWLSQTVLIFVRFVKRFLLEKFEDKKGSEKNLHQKDIYIKSFWIEVFLSFFKFAYRIPSLDANYVPNKCQTTNIEITYFSLSRLKILFPLDIRGFLVHQYSKPRIPRRRIARTACILFEFLFICFQNFKSVELNKKAMWLVWLSFIMIISMLFIINNITWNEKIYFSKTMYIQSKLVITNFMESTKNIRYNREDLHYNLSFGTQIGTIFFSL